MYVRMYVCMCVFTDIGEMLADPRVQGMYVCMYVCVYVCINIGEILADSRVQGMYVCMYVCVCMYGCRGNVFLPKCAGM